MIGVLRIIGILRVLGLLRLFRDNTSYFSTKSGFFAAFCGIISMKIIKKCKKDTFMFYNIYFYDTSFANKLYFYTQNITNLTKTQIYEKN